MKSNFNLIAPVYDRLARLVFGKSIVRSQTWFLNEVPANARVLILGGGTGWLLEELIKSAPTINVVYIEASTKMLQITTQRKLNDKTTLILGTEENIPSHAFDVVITNFYLDLFPEEKLNDIIQKITTRTTAASVWIATDFVLDSKWWQRVMLKIMYVFFRAASSIEASHLPTWGKSMLQHAWTEQDSKLWYRGFIKSVLFRRRDGI